MFSVVAFLGALLLFLSCGAAQAAPRGGSITEGAGRLAYQEGRTDIHQKSQFLATKWNNFDIGAGEVVQAHQPNVRAQILIRVDSASPSRISGNLLANGQVIVENNAGIQFKQGSVVNVGGLLARAANGDIVAEGSITANSGGVWLSGRNVRSGGTISVQQGKSIGYAEGKLNGLVEARPQLVSTGGAQEASRMVKIGGVIVLEGSNHVIVEKEARLEAPNIRVGGDFQGKGNIRPAQRTLVQADAELNAGQGGTVVVWSDELTWFYGAVNALDGFAEISGKAHLAHVNYAGLNIGAGTVLFDPKNIIFVAAGNLNSGEKSTLKTALEDDEIATGDFPNQILKVYFGVFNQAPFTSQTGATYIFAATNDITISDGTWTTSDSTMTMILQAGRNINVKAHITFAGHLRLEAGVGAGAGQIFFLGVDVYIPLFGGIPGRPNAHVFNTVRVGSLRLEQDGAVFPDAAPATFLNSSAHAFITPTLDYTGNAVQSNVTWGSVILPYRIMKTEAGNVNLLDELENLGFTLDSGIIKLGPRRLVVDAPNNALILSEDFLGIYSDGEIKITAKSIKRSTGENQDFILRAGENLILNTSININTGALTLTAGHGDGTGYFDYNKDLIIQARNITLEADAALPPAANKDLILSASGNITISANLNAGSGTIRIVAGSGSTTGRISFTTDRTPTLTGRVIELGQNIGVFPSAAPAAFLNSNGVVVQPSLYYSGGAAQPNVTWGTVTSPVRIKKTGADDVNLETELTKFGVTLDNDGIIDLGPRVLLVYVPSNALILSSNFKGIRSGGAISIQAKSIGRTTGNDQDFILYAGRYLFLNTSTFNINGGDLTLTAGSGTGDFYYTKDLTIQARNITLNANRTSPFYNKDQDLTLTATGNISINTNLNIGSGDLIITAGEGSTTGTISFAEDQTLMASAIRLEQDGAVFLDAAPATFKDNNNNAVQPYLYYSGSDIQRSDVSWGSVISPIVITATFNSEVAILTELAKFGLTPNNNGIVDLGPRRLSVDAQSNPLILPSALLGVYSDKQIEITASSIGRSTGNDQDFILRAGENLILNISIFNINAGTLTLTAGHGSGTGYFYYNQDLLIQAGNITLTADAAPLAANHDLTLTATSNITINSYILVESSDVTLTAGDNMTINSYIIANSGDLTITADGYFYYNQDLLLQARNITLTADAAPPSAANHDLTLTAAGNMIITTGLNLELGDLTLTAGGNMTTNRDIYARSGDVALTAAGNMTSNGYIFAGSGALTLTAGDNIIITADLNARSGDLILTATGYFSYNQDLIIEAGNITLTADKKPPATNHDLTLTATGDISINGHLDVGSGDITITAGYGDGTGYFSYNQDLVIKAGNITFNADMSPPAAANKNLTLTAAGNMIINANLNAGSGDITITAGYGDGTGYFSYNQDLVIKAGNIILNADISPPAVANKNLTLTATGDMTINAALNLGSGDLTLTAGDNITTNKSIIIRSGDLTLTAEDNITINANLNLGSGALTLTAGGNMAIYNVIQVGSSGSLTFTATGNMTINNIILTDSGDIILTAGGNMMIINANLYTAGDLTITAGSGESTTGTISFTGNPGLTASTITLEQDGAVFPSTKPAVTFSIAPVLIYSGTGVQLPVPWQSPS